MGKQGSEALSLWWLEKNSGQRIIQFPHFTGKITEVQSGKETCFPLIQGGNTLFKVTDLTSISLFPRQQSREYT